MLLQQSIEHVSIIHTSMYTHISPILRYIGPFDFRSFRSMFVCNNEVYIGIMIFLWYTFQTDDVV